MSTEDKIQFLVEKKRRSRTGWRRKKERSAMFLDNKPYTFDRIARISVTAGLL